MSNRHRTSELVLPHHEERRVQARSERHRVNTALADVTGLIQGGTEPDDIVEPAVGFRAERHHDPERGRPSAAGVVTGSSRCGSGARPPGEAKAAMERFAD